MAADLAAPPELHGPDDSGERRASWLELFYDLIFVAALSRIGENLAHDAGLVGVLRSFGLFVPIWWIWVGHTVYATRFANENLVERLWTFVQMLAIAAMAVRAADGGEAGTTEFALAYVLARLSLLGLYWHAHRHVPEARPVTALYLKSFSPGPLLWAISILFPAPLRQVLWATGVASDLAAPWLGRAVLRRAPLDTSHLPERFGLFFTIVIGEAMFALVTGTAHVHWAVAARAAAVLAFALAVCIWWMYFTFFEVFFHERSLGSGQSFIYAHLPLLFAVLLLGVGLERAIVEVEHAHLAGPTLWLLGTGAALWLGAFLLTQLVSVRRRHRRGLAARYLGGGAVCAGCLLAGAVLPPLATLALLVGVFAALLLAEIRRTAQADAPDGAAEPAARNM